MVAAMSEALEQAVGQEILGNEAGVVIVAGRQIVYMPVWFYGLALLGFLALGFGIGYLAFA